MKKILAIALCVVMVLATGVVFAGAEIPSKIGQTSGNWVTSQDDFATLDSVNIAWDEQMAEKITFDGNMDDWVATGLSPYKIEPRNMVSWVGGSADGTDPDMPENFSVTYYVAADPYYLYIGFYVVDDDVVIGDNATSYNGDAFQVCLDFGGVLTKLVKEDPDLAGDNPKNVFYSFSMIQNTAGELQPMQIMVQENGDDEGNNLLDTQDPDSGAKGAYGLTEDGWCAEFALSWERLYYDFSYKTYTENPEDQITVFFGPDQDFVMGGCIYYLNKNQDKGVIWAAGTTAGETRDDGVTPVVTWTAYDNSLNMVLKYKDGMEFPNVPNVVILEEGTQDIEIPTQAEDPTEESDVKTEAPTDPVTEAATEASTAASTEKASETTADSDDDGCASVVAGGTIAVVLSAMAAAVALKKKH